MPLYDDNPFKLPHSPVVTWSLIGANIFAFLLEVGSGSPTYIAHRFGVIPAAVIGTINIPGAVNPFLSLITYQFVHADVVHVVGNLIFLWVFGDNVEQALGRWRFLLFYLGVGLLAGVAFVLSIPNSRVPLIGASGAISGVVIAYAMLRPCAKITALVFGIPMRISAYWIIGVFVLLQFINLRAASKSDVAWWCHVGGMSAGAALFPALRLPGVKLFECIRPGDLPPKRVTAIPSGPPGTTLR